LDDNVDLGRQHVHFVFRGKSGKQWEVKFRDRRLASAIRQCQELPGQELFRYYNSDRQLRTATSEDVNAYLRSITGQEFTAKDFRTWGASVLAARLLVECGAGDSAAKNLKMIRSTVKEVAHSLRNTPTVCRKYYIHPHILESYLANEFCGAFEQSMRTCDNSCGLAPEEQALLAFLRAHQVSA